jgi:hypothetical protein
MDEPQDTIQLIRKHVFMVLAALVALLPAAPMDMPDDGFQPASRPSAQVSQVDDDGDDGESNTRA